MIVPEPNRISKILRFPMGKGIQKPRSTGRTMVIDKGMGLNALEDLLYTCSPYIDVIKFGFGTAMLYPQDVLKKKLDLARLYRVDTCTGGTLGEIALCQGKFKHFVESVSQLGFSVIEISDGTINLPTDKRLQAIQVASGYLRVISEVGKKLDNFPEISQVAEQIQSDIDTGSDYVIIEGRESGENVGIYSPQGDVQSDLLDQLLQLLPQSTMSRLMFEAPKKRQQVELIKRFGSSVSLGNIAPDEVMAVECLRRGLRADTFSFTLNN